MGLGVKPLLHQPPTTGQPTTAHFHATREFIANPQRMLARLLQS